MKDNCLIISSCSNGSWCRWEIILRNVRALGDSDKELLSRLHLIDIKTVIFIPRSIAD